MPDNKITPEELEGWRIHYQKFLDGINANYVKWLKKEIKSLKIRLSELEEELNDRK